MGCLLALLASPNLILELSQQELEISCLIQSSLGHHLETRQAVPMAGASCPNPSGLIRYAAH